MQPVVQTIEEIDDGKILMLCSDQHKGRMPEKISTGTSESHVFEIDYWCVFAGIEKLKTYRGRNMSSQRQRPYCLKRVIKT